MKNKWHTSLLLLVILMLSSFTSHHVEAMPGSNYQYKITFQTKSSPSVSQGFVYMREGTLYVELTDFANTNGLQANFDTTGKRAGFNGWLRKLAVRDGSKIAVVNGKTVTMAKPAYFTKQKNMDTPAVYVPFQFAVEALGGTYTGYDAKTKIVKAKNLPQYDVVYATHEGMTYAIEKTGGRVLAWDGKHTPVLLTSLQDDLDWAGLDVRVTPKGLLLLSVSNSYGEPHINQETYQLLFKDRKLLRQNHANFHWSSSDQVDTYNGYILMNDSQQVRLIEDGSGNVVQTIDLVKLGNQGTDQRYSLEAIYDDILLIRNITNHALYVADRRGEHSVALYQQVLSDSEREEREIEMSSNDPFNNGDGLTFTKRSGNILYFTFQPWAETKPRNVTYDLSKLTSK